MTDYGTNMGAADGASRETTVSALFDSRAEADRAIERLRSGGVPDGSIQLTAGTEEPALTQGRTEERGFFEALSDFFFPDDDRQVYAEGLTRGGYLVTVTGLGQPEYDAALDILDDEGAVDIDEREAAWRAEGWRGDQGSLATDEAPPAVGYQAAQTGFDADVAGERTLGDGETISVVEERMRVGKRDASNGRVRVRSYVREVPVSEEIELTSERVEIERRPVDRALESGEDAFRDRSIEAEEHSEEAVVSKEARVTEEIGLRRERDTHVETVSDTERHTEVEIEDERDGKAKERSRSDRV